ncbi:MAG: oligosaccharide flippase family protein, partial [Clostridia bacterium]|nr:oligosaccharide flippase family protein [Clostridia bacterium]
MEKVKKPRLIKSAGLLAAGSIIAKIIGALYRIPLTNILGAEGMGMYQLVFPVFALFIVLSSAGVPTALSRIIAEKRVEGE